LEGAGLDGTGGLNGGGEQAVGGVGIQQIVPLEVTGGGGVQLPLHAERRVQTVRAEIRQGLEELVVEAGEDAAIEVDH